MNRQTRADLLLIAILWVLSILLVDPRGDFPLSDDCAHGTAVQRLVEEGGYRPVDWSPMTLVSQVLWGALFCLPAGFSFTALRLSTLVLSFLGVCSVYLIVRELGRPRWLAILAALTVAFSPMYCALSYTFMTDVPFAATASMAMWAFLVSLRSESTRYLVLATCLSVAAVLCRQLGLFLPFAFGAGLLLKHGLSRRTLVRAAIPMAVCIGAFVAWSAWLKYSGIMSGLYFSRPLSILTTLMHLTDVFHQKVKLTWTIFLYTGLFLFPLLLAVFPGFLRQQAPRWRVVLCAVVVIAAYASAKELRWFERLIPNGPGNIFIEGGIGPITLRDTCFLVFPHFAPVPRVVWKLATIAGILGFGMLAAMILSMLVDLVFRRALFRRDEDRTAGLMFLAGACVYLLPLVAMGDFFFDRYVVPVSFLLAAVIVSSVKLDYLPSRRYVLGAVGAVVCCFAAFSVAATHDYLAWNRARWEGLRYLAEQEHVGPERIDGGFEFNALCHFTNPSSQAALTAIDESKPIEQTKSWWWVQDDEYIVALGELPGYDVIHKVGFSRWLPRSEGAIHLLHRQERASGDVEVAARAGLQDGASK